MGTNKSQKKKMKKGKAGKKIKTDTASVVAKVIDDVIEMKKRPVNLNDEFGKSDDSSENELVIDMQNSPDEKVVTGTLNAYYLNEKETSDDGDNKDEKEEASKEVSKVLREGSERGKVGKIEKGKNCPRKKGDKSDVEGKENVARDWWEINQEKEFD